MHMKRKITTLFGNHSRRVWRSLIGALWTAPFRFITLPTAMLATGMCDFSGSARDVFFGVVKGAGIGLFFMVIQLLVNEYVVFEYIKRFFTGSKK